MDCKFTPFVFFLVITSTLYTFTTGNIINFKAEVTSQTTGRVKYNVLHTKDPPPNVKYIIEYCFKNSTNCKSLYMQGKQTTFFKFIGGIKFHTTYKFRVSSNVYPSTQWLTVAADIKTFILNSEMKLFYKDAFKKSFKTLLPSGFIMAREINVIRAEKIESWVDVSYEIFYPKSSNVAAIDISNSFELSKIGNISSYLRSVNVTEMDFCTNGKSVCDVKSLCYNKDASYYCKCKLGYIDISHDPNLFPGKLCVINTAPPTYTKMWSVGREKVVVSCKPPRTHKAQGKVIQFEVQWKNNSGVFITTGSQFFKANPLQNKLELTGLTGYHYYDVRVRAITTRGPGKWSKEWSFHMVSDLYQLEFEIELFDQPESYDGLIQSHVHKTVSDLISFAVKYEKELNITEVVAYKSELISQQKIKIWNKIFFTKKALERMKSITGQLHDYKKLLIKPLSLNLKVPAVGMIIESSIKVKDYSECRDANTRCSSINGCQEILGSYKCVCPRLTVDVSKSFKVPTGTVCRQISEPLEFRASLQDRKTVRLSWKVPKNLRDSRIEFWFVLRSKKAGDSVYTAKRVYPPSGNVSDPNYLIFYNREIEAGITHSFRVTTQVAKQYGKWSKWLKMATSDYVFKAEFYLFSTIMYTYDLIDTETQIYSQLIAHVYNAVDSTLKQPLPQFIAAGEAEIKRANENNTDSTDVVVSVSLFFDPKSRVDESYIENMFLNSPARHNEKFIDYEKTIILDYDECESKWNECNISASCVNQSPGYICICFEDFKDWSDVYLLPPGTVCVPEDYTTTISTTTEDLTTASLTTTILTTETKVIKKGDRNEAGSDKGVEDISDEDSIYGGSDAFEQDLTSNYETPNTKDEEVIYYDTVLDKDKIEQDKHTYDYYESGKISDYNERTSVENNQLEIKNPLTNNKKEFSSENNKNVPLNSIPMTRYRTRPITTITTRNPLPMTKILIFGRGVDKTTILVTWKRQTKLIQGKQLRELRYIFRYKVKGTIEWIQNEVSAQISSLTFKSLMPNVIYEFCVAEQWTKEFKPHTSFSIPIEVRLVVHTFLVHLHISDVPASSSGISYLRKGSQQYEYLNYISSKYVNDVLSLRDLRAQFPTILFGSTDGEVTFNRHPDESLTAFVKIFLTPRKSLKAKLIQQAFQTFQSRIKSELNIKFWLVSDIDECGSQKLNDCPHSSICTNTEGSYYCSCMTGYYDDSSFYFLLAGRYCNVPTTTTLFITSTEPRRDTTVNDEENRRKLFLHNNGTFKSKVKVLRGDCLPGQYEVGYICEETMMYQGLLDVVQPPNELKTDSVIEVESMEETLNLKLDEILSKTYFEERYVTSKVKSMKAMKNNKGFHAMFITTIKKQSFKRIRRQVNIFEIEPEPVDNIDHKNIYNNMSNDNVVPQTQISLNAFNETSQSPYYVKQEKIPLTKAYNKPIPNENIKITRENLQSSINLLLSKNPEMRTGTLMTKEGAKSTFVVKNLQMIDVNECSNTILNDCDVTHGKCTNTDGSFMCSCRYTKNLDLKRPGRNCAKLKFTPEKSSFSKVDVKSKDSKNKIDENLPHENKAALMAIWTICGVLFFIIIAAVLQCKNITKKMKRDKKLSIYEFILAYF